MKDEDNLAAQQKIVDFCREVAIISQNILKRWAEEKARLDETEAKVRTVLEVPDESR